MLLLAVLVLAGLALVASAGRVRFRRRLAPLRMVARRRRRFVRRHW